MENLQIFHINVNCSNLDRSLEFYKAIGFKELLDFNKKTNALATKKIDEKKAPIELGLGPALGLPEESRGRARLLVLGDDPRATRLDLIEWIEPKAEGQPYPHLFCFSYLSQRRQHKGNMFVVLQFDSTARAGLEYVSLGSIS